MMYMLYAKDGNVFADGYGAKHGSCSIMESVLDWV